jgi:hypothetical protein
MSKFAEKYLVFPLLCQKAVLGLLFNFEPPVLSRGAPGNHMYRYEGLRTAHR